MTADRDALLWLPYFEQHDVSVNGEEWPAYVVEKWERNALGETRFTGEVRAYRAALAAEPPAPAFVVLSEPASVTHNPKPDWTVTHQRSTTCPFCSEAAALDAHHEIGSQPETCNWCRQYARLASEERP